MVCLRGMAFMSTIFFISGVTDFDYSGSEFNFKTGLHFQLQLSVESVILSHRPDLLVKDVRKFCFNR